MPNHRVGPMRRSFALAASSTSVGTMVNLTNRIIQGNEDSTAKQIGKMMLVIMVPVVAVIVQTSISLSEALTTQQSATVLGEVIDYALHASEGIQLVQKERGLTALYMGSQSVDIQTYRQLASSRVVSNAFLSPFTIYQTILLPSAHEPINTGRDIIQHLNSIRAAVDLQNDNVSLLGVIEKYTEVSVAMIMASLRVSLVPSRQDIWVLVVSFGALSRAIDVFGVQQGIGGAAFSTCGLSTKERNTFMVLNSEHATWLSSCFQYHPPAKALYEASYTSDSDLRKMLTQQKFYILNNSAMAELCGGSGERADQQAQLWLKAATQYMDLLTVLQKNLTAVIRKRIPDMKAQARFNMAAYLGVMIVVSVTCLLLSVWYSLQLGEMTSKMKAGILKVRAKSEAVKDEKKKTDFLLYQMMPRRVADTLKNGMVVNPEWFDSVTVYFSDIKGWYDICVKSSPHQIVTLLNDLYIEFDDVIMKYDVYKVETIADSYMCASGLPEKTPEHVKVIATLALEMIAFAKTFKILHLPDTPLGLRIGFHSGPCVAGVVGTLAPRYCLFGDTVNTASRMETNGEPFKIHISEASQRLLEKIGNFNIQYRGRIPIKGKGEMATYWLLTGEED